MGPKSSKNASKCKMERYQKKIRFLNDFWWILDRFWEGFGRPNRSFGVPNPSPRRPWACQNRKDRPRAPQDPSWRPTWRHFGSILAQLGAILAPSWPNLEHFAIVLEAKIGPRSGRSQDARRRPKSRFLVKFWCFALTTSRLLPQCSFMILILSSPIIQTRVFRAFRFTACRSRSEKRPHGARVRSYSVAFI